MEVYAIDKITGHKWTLEELTMPIDYEELSLIDYILSDNFPIYVGHRCTYNDSKPDWARDHYSKNGFIKYNKDDIELYIDGKLWKKY